MIPPSYQELPAAQVPVATAPGISVKVIAGKSMGVEAKVHTNSPIYYLDVSLDPSTTFEQEIPQGWTAFVYTLEGEATFAGQVVPPHATAVLQRNGDHLRVETGGTAARFVLVAGQPIGEPIVQHGPFVMNTTAEIEEAIRDFQMGVNGFERASAWRSKIGRQL